MNSIQSLSEFLRERAAKSYRASIVKGNAGEAAANAVQKMQEYASVGWNDSRLQKEASTNKYVAKSTELKSITSTNKPADLTKSRSFRSMRMGQHTTPDDLLPNPTKMDVKVS